MTGDTITSYIESNYDFLRSYVEKYNLSEDIINDVYIRVSNKVTVLTGLTSGEYLNYVRKSIWNDLRDQKKKESRRGINISVDLVSSVELNEKLEELNWSEEEYRVETEWLVKKMFQYIKESGKFSDWEVFILKSYVFCDTTYKELEDKIGVSEDVCKKTMRKFRTILRDQFLKWLKNDKRGIN